MEHFKKLRDPREFLITSENLILPGSEIQLNFDIPFIQTELNAKPINLKGSVPFLLKHGEYPKVVFYEMTESEQRKWVVYYFSKLDKIQNSLSSLLTEDSKKHSEARCIFAILAVLMFSPDFHPESSKFDVAFEAAAVSIYLDDLFDSCTEESTREVSLYFLEFIDNCSKMQDKKIEDCNKYQYVRIIMQNIFRRIGVEVPGILTNLKYFWKRMEKMVTMSQVPFCDGEEFLLQRSYTCGIDLAVEMKASSLGLILDDKIRESDLFNKMMETYNVICVILNDFVGLNLDQKKTRELQDNYIIRKKEKSGGDITSAFNHAMLIFNKKHQNLTMEMKSLKETFPNDIQDIEQFLKIMKEIYDSLVYTYFGHGEYRYGNVKGNYSIDATVE